MALAKGKDCGDCVGLCPTWESLGSGISELGDCMKAALGVGQSSNGNDLGLQLFWTTGSWSLPDVMQPRFGQGRGPTNYVVTRAKRVFWAARGR